MDVRKRQEEARRLLVVRVALLERARRRVGQVAGPGAETWEEAGSLLGTGRRACRPEISPPDHGVTALKTGRAHAKNALVPAAALP